LIYVTNQAMTTVAVSVVGGELSDSH